MSFKLDTGYFCKKRKAMNDNGKINRRDFIKSSVLTGGVLFAQAAIPARAMDFLSEKNKNENAMFTDDGLVKGVCDIHLHCRPDSRERSVDEYGFMQDAMRAGYRAVMFKSNDFSCHDRAYIIRQALPEAECFGSFCMNRVHGDKVNPFAAQKAVETSGGLCRCIWMPTLDAAYHYQCEGRKEKGIPVLDDNGQVLPEIIRIMEICAEAGIIFATGHASPQESITLARKAKEIGVDKFVVTHANSHFWKMTADQIKQCIDLGLLPALPVGKRHKDAAIFPAKHRGACRFCPHRPVAEFHFHRLGTGGDATPHRGHEGLHPEIADRRHLSKRY